MQSFTVRSSGALVAIFFIVNNLFLKFVVVLHSVESYTRTEHK
jgi:hypothetical protein